MAKHLSLEEIQTRLRIGGPENFMRRHIANDNGAVKRFIDASVIPLWTQTDDGDTSWLDGGDVVTDVPIGQGNQLTANLLTKEASIAINDPDWHVVAQKADEQTGEMIDDPQSALIARAYLRSEWKMKNWTRISRRSLQKCNMTGLGVLRYFWGEDGCEFEHIQSWDLAADPFLKDWQKLKYGGIRLRKTLRDAKDAWPTGKFRDKIADGNQNADTERVDVWLYYDKNTEAAVYDDQLLNKTALDNPYGKVPLHILEGDIYPGRSPFPLGDSILALGAQAELSDLNLYISNIAKHGGPRNFADAGLDPSAKDNLEKGEQQGVIFVKALDPQRPPLIRIPGERLEPAVLEAKQEARNELDSITGVNQYDRGVLTDKPKFATEVAVSANRSGVRGSQARINFEKYVSRMAEICIELTVKFGGPHVSEGGEHVASYEHTTLWEALKNVTEVHVIEGCFTGDTLVDTPNGPTPIENMKSGDLVWSAAGLDKVLSVCRRTHKDLYRISTSHGEFHCSFNHPFFVTDRGFVAACDLSEGDILETREVLLGMSDTVPMQWAKGDRAPEDLLSTLSHGPSMEESRRSAMVEPSGETVQRYRGGECKERANDTRGIVSERSVSKQDAPVGSAPEGVGHSQTNRDTASTPDWMERCAEGRQGSRSNGTTVQPMEGSWARGLAGRLDYTAWEEARRISKLIRGRPSSTGNKTSCRGGREIPLCACSERERQKEGTGAIRARVDGVTRIARGDSSGDRYRGTNGQFSLWDIEVERHPTFFVNGVLVHNSTTFKDPMQEQQQSMQLATMTTQAYPLMMQLAMTGVMQEIPDLKKIWDRVYRAFGVNNTEQMWIQAPEQQQGAQGKPPIEMLSYKDAPPDIRRQMEQQAGMTPSQMETQSPAQLSAAPQQAAGPDTLAHHVDLIKQARDHQHETRLQMLKMMHEQALKQAELQSQAQQAKVVASSNGRGQ